MARLVIIVTAVILAAGAGWASDYEPAAMTVPASSTLEPGVLKGKHHSITQPVSVDGYMNRFTVDSDFGQFTVVGDLALKILLHEIDAIAELKKISAAEAGTDAAVSAVGKSTSCVDAARTKS